MELLKNNVNRLESIVAIGLAVAALTACDQRAEANTIEIVSVVPDAKTIYTVAQTPSISKQLEKSWSDVMANRQGNVDIAIHDNVTGQNTEYTNAPEAQYDTASTIKLAILEKILLQAETNGHPLTYDELVDQYPDVVPMIESSDDTAASNLWVSLGGAPVIQDFYDQIGAKSTKADTDDEWGFTPTTAEDQLKVVDQIAYPETSLSLLSPTSTATANQLLSQVIPEQRWGIGTGLPNTVTFENKNGWMNYSRSEGNVDGDWTMNSIGHVHGQVNGRTIDDTIAVYTDGNPDEQYGIDTTDILSAATWSVILAVEPNS